MKNNWKKRYDSQTEAFDKAQEQIKFLLKENKTLGEVNTQLNSDVNFHKAQHDQALQEKLIEEMRARNADELKEKVKLLEKIILNQSNGLAKLAEIL